MNERVMNYLWSAYGFFERNSDGRNSLASECELFRNRTANLIESLESEDLTALVESWREREDRRIEIERCRKNNAA